MDISVGLCHYLILYCVTYGVFYPSFISLWFPNIHEGQSWLWFYGNWVARYQWNHNQSSLRFDMATPPPIIVILNTTSVSFREGSHLCLRLPVHAIIANHHCCCWCRNPPMLGILDTTLVFSNYKTERPDILEIL